MKRILICIISACFLFSCAQTKKTVKAYYAGCGGTKGGQSYPSAREAEFSFTPKDSIFPELLESFERLQEYTIRLDGNISLGNDYMVLNHSSSKFFQLWIFNAFSKHCFVFFESRCCNEALVKFKIETFVETFDEVTSEKVATHIIAAARYL